MNRLSRTFRHRPDSPFGIVSISLDIPSTPNPRPTLTVTVFPEAIVGFSGRGRAIRNADETASMLQRITTGLFVDVVGVGVELAAESSDRRRATYEVHPEGRSYADFVRLLCPEDPLKIRVLERRFYV